MTSETVRPGFQSVVPFLSVQRAPDLVDFVVAAFDATETFRSKTHFEVKIGNSMVMIGDVGDRPPATGQHVRRQPGSSIQTRNSSGSDVAHGTFTSPLGSG
jgi:uncharacterized glyoxalase superfamily protein PhnB